MSLIIPTAEPFFVPGGPNGCLLVHGFTGAPKEMRWMGEYLAAQGHAVLGVRLAGHATQPGDLPRARWRDWVASVEDGYDILRGASPRVFVMGLSMGGILSLLFAARYPVAGVVAMSTPYALPDDWRLRYLKLFRLIQPRIPKGASDWRDLDAAKDHVDYPYYPTRAIVELVDLVAEMQAGLARVTAPVLLIHSRQDGSVPPENMQSLYDHIGAKDKHMLWVENSGHVVTREPERLRVFQAADEFVRRVSAQGGATP